jgi:hypothetical protein
MAKRKEQKAHDSADEKWLKQAYAASRENFTAEELQKYTVNEKGIPAEQVLAEMEEIHRKYSRKAKG